MARLSLKLLDSMARLSLKLLDLSVCVGISVFNLNSENEMPSGTRTILNEDSLATEDDSKSDQMTITLEQNEGKEIKLTMKKSAKVNFVWFTDGGKANFDTHADSKALGIDYHSYEKGSLVELIQN